MKQIIKEDDKLYPERLKKIKEHPKTLYTLGNINCYDISQIYDIVEDIKTNESNRNFDNETIITKDNLHLFNNQHY